MAVENVVEKKTNGKSMDFGILAKITENAGLKDQRGTPAQVKKEKIGSGGESKPKSVEDFKRKQINLPNQWESLIKSNYHGTVTAFILSAIREKLSKDELFPESAKKYLD